MEIELCNITSVDTRIQFSNTENLDNTLSSCWNCKEGSNESKGNVISPCNCAHKFLHIYCLELLANILKILHCPYCQARYPLEIQRKSFLQMFQKVSILFIKIMFFNFCNFLMISLLIYIFSHYKDWSFEFIIMESFGSSLFFCVFYMTGRIVINWSKKIYQLCYQWYKSTQEWKLMEGYNVNIRNI